MLTVLMATRNRADVLREVLEAYLNLRPPLSGWKLVVVDNGSTDETARVAASFGNRLPLHFLLEKKLGKNFALNSGLALAEGDLTVFTDDDAFPAANWLVQLRKAADDHKGYTMFGGTILPRWEVAPPDWVNWIADPGPVYTLTDPALPEGPIAPYLVFGPNLAVRADVFSSGVRFDNTIGPSGSSYAMGSETELLLRLGRQGHKAWHVPEAVVEHFIRKEQLNEEWVLQRAIRWGRGRYRMCQDVKLWFGVPRHLFRDIPKEAITLIAASISRKRRASFQAHWRFNVLCGMALEARLMAGHPNATKRSTLVHNGSHQRQ